MPGHNKQHGLGDVANHSSCTVAEFNALLSDGPIGGGGGLTWSKITGNTNAVKDNGYAIVASGNVTVTLPATPTEGAGGRRRALHVRSSFNTAELGFSGGFARWRG